MAESLGVTKLREWCAVDPESRTTSAIAGEMRVSGQTVRNWLGRGTVPDKHTRPKLALFLGAPALARFGAWTQGGEDDEGEPMTASERRRIVDAAGRFARIAQARAS